MTDKLIQSSAEFVAGFVPPAKRQYPILSQPNAGEVPIRGDGPSAIWWRGAQWAVTQYGIECLDGTYPIEAKRLLENCDVHGWPRHMSLKEWVNTDDFITAFCVALVMHGLTEFPPNHLRGWV